MCAFIAFHWQFFEMRPALKISVTQWNHSFIVVVLQWLWWYRSNSETKVRSCCVLNQLLHLGKFLFCGPSPMTVLFWCVCGQLKMPWEYKRISRVLKLCFVCAAGGPYGSLGVDYEFEKLLCKIFGEDFIEQFKIKRPAAWVDLMIAFESRKRAAAPDRTNPLNITLPFSFIDYYKKFRGHSVEHALRKSKWVGSWNHMDAELTTGCKDK